MNKEALIEVDVEKDFCPGGSLAVKDGDQVVEPLNQVSSAIRRRKGKVFVTRDWHPAVTTHFAKYGGLWPEHCVQNTEGAKFHPRLNIEDAVVVVSKGMGEAEDAYSGFDARTEDGKSLGALLKEAGVGKVYIGGLATDYCVKATAIDAVKNGFVTTLLADACRAVNINPGDEEKAIREMAEAGVIISSTQEVLKEWAS